MFYEDTSPEAHKPYHPRIWLVGWNDSSSFEVMWDDWKSYLPENLEEAATPMVAQVISGSWESVFGALKAFTDEMEDVVTDYEQPQADLFAPLFWGWEFAVVGSSIKPDRFLLSATHSGGIEAFVVFQRRKCYEDRVHPRRRSHHRQDTEAAGPGKGHHP